MPVDGLSEKEVVENTQSHKGGCDVEMLPGSLIREGFLCTGYTRQRESLDAAELVCWCGLSTAAGSDGGG